MFHLFFRSFTLITLLLFCSTANAAMNQLRDEGTQKGYPWALDCVGSTIACAVSGGIGTITVSAGAGDVESVGDCTSGDCFNTGGSGTEMLVPAGTLKLGGVDGSNNEAFTIDFETVANRMTFNSTTFASFFFSSGVIMEDSEGFFLGTSSDAKFVWLTSGNDRLDLGLPVGAASGSGFYQIMELADLNNANRRPLTTPANPTVRIYSSDAAVAGDFIEFSHNQTDAILNVGAGDLKITAAGGDVDFADENLSTTGTLAAGVTTIVGSVVVGNGTTSAGIIQIDEDDDDGSNNATFTVPALTADTDYTLPPDDGDSGEFLRTDGDGILTWVAAGGSGDVTAVGDCASGDCFTGASGTTLTSNTDLIMALDEDNNGTESFQILDGADALIVEVLETGLITTLVGLDGIGAVDLDYGSADITDHTFTSDGGTAIIDGSISTSRGATASGILIILEDTDAGTNNATFIVPALTADTDYTLPPDDGDAGEVLQTDGDGVLTWEADAGGADTNSPKLYYWSSSASLPLQPIADLATGASDGVAPIVKDTDTNTEILVIAFDDTADEFRQVMFKVPSDVAVGSNVTITFEGYAATAAAQDIAIIFAHYAVADGENWDGNMTEEALTTTLTNTQDANDYVTHTETSTSLGWAANDTVIAYIGRDGDHATDDGLTGDFHLIALTIEIPRA